MKIIMPIGISGSGKSRLYKESYSNLFLVSPDNLRRELTGDISDQSRNGEVFRRANEMIMECVEKGVDVFYDATNINTKLRKKFVNEFVDNPNVEVVYIVLPANIDVSYSRIQKDLDNQVDRSKVGWRVLEHQMEMYKYTMDTHFAGENVHEVVYLKEE